LTYSVNITATNQVVNVTNTSANVVVSDSGTIIFTVTTTSTNVVVNSTLTNVNAFYDAVELRLNNLNTYWKGAWRSGTYNMGDLVNYNDSIFLLKDFSSDITAVYTSTIVPPSDTTYWNRIVWHEAPFDHVTVTNALIVGTDATINGNANIRNNLSVTGTTHLVGNLVMDTPLDHLTVTNLLSAGSIAVGGLTGNGLVINTTSTFNGTATFNGPAVFRNDVDMRQADLYLNNLHLTGYIVNTATTATFLISTTNTNNQLDAAPLELREGFKVRFGMSGQQFAITGGQPAQDNSGNYTGLGQGSIFPWEGRNQFAWDTKYPYSENLILSSQNILRLQGLTSILSNNTCTDNGQTISITQLDMRNGYCLPYNTNQVNGRYNANVVLYNHYLSNDPTSNGSFVSAPQDYNGIVLLNVDRDGGLLAGVPTYNQGGSIGPLNPDYDYQGRTFITLQGDLNLGNYASINSTLYDNFKVVKPKNTVKYKLNDAMGAYVDWWSYTGGAGYPGARTGPVNWDSSLILSPDGANLTAPYFAPFVAGVALGPTPISTASGGINLQSGSIILKAPDAVLPYKVDSSRGYSTTTYTIKEANALGARYGVWIDSTLTTVTGELDLKGPLVFPDGSIQRTASSGAAGTAFDFGSLSIPAAFTLDMGHI
jgi:hypothetical protein